MSRNILVVPTNSSHIRLLKPLIDALMQQGVSVRALCVDALQKEPYQARASLEKHGVPYDNLEAGQFDPRRHWLLQRRHWPDVVERMRAFLADRKLDALIFGADCGLVSRTLVRLAKQASIPVVVIPDGLLVPANPAYRPNWIKRGKKAGSDLMARLFDWGGERGTSGADRILLMNENGRQLLTALGVDPLTIEVVGSPEYDALGAEATGASDGDGQSLRRRLSIAEDRRIVLFAHQGALPTEMTRMIVRAGVEALRNLDATFLVKFHPRGPQQIDQWRAWVLNEGLPAEDVVFVRDECTSIEAVRACCACVTAFSTVAVEAMICRKPVILFTRPSIPFALPYARESGAAIETRTPEELTQAVRQVISDPQVTATLVRRATTMLATELLGPDGRSLERMVASVLATMKGTGAGCPGGS